MAYVFWEVTKMTPAKLRQMSLDRNSKFFTRNNMKFCGDTMANYGVRENTIDTWTETKVKVWELYRRKPVKMGLQGSAYFRKTNGEHMHKKREA